ncbi:hypothetical protein MYCTH_2304545 [Thermothelomyces thermophilus ATCC 42464]|uniref:MOZ protein represents a chromatin-associated acetyltransferase n=1 Tax=Thermothelomyces thermophilus (strain ATCC 42464 / BCRC 31852 / DSM 1799) TaxID=573729 RepID=G2QER6_THET4|nr:uncharacterized protein MYCTH_2304545 [Thermothelomyces thermophilus ATCC 42464]AEO57849.1 hypothetical protein MYCTH_2304545 [Thermothelomyces thermophilus ATCC 42464]
MATNRLTFLYPHLFRTGGRCWTEPAASSHAAARRPRRNPNPSPRPPASCQHAAPFTTPSAGRQAAFAKRAGKAIEPLPLDPPKPPPPKSEAEKREGQETGRGTTTAPHYSSPSSSSSSSSSSPAPSGDASKQSTSSPKSNLPPTIELPPPADIDPVTQAKKGSPIDEILHMGPPPDSLPSAPPGAPGALASEKKPSEPASKPLAESTEPETGAKPPQLVPTPYIHHFDSYTLVKQLTAGGYTLPQAIISMKAIRTILAHNLDMAQSGLVSKADVENETYLFRAACSELSAEVRNNRRVADEQLRQQRTMLQHEVDILAQRLNQELLTLNDNVRGMFNDRRMAVREEQKAVESRIQQINYKISVALNSEAKSNIEALRWVLIRRSVLGIIFMAVLTLGTIRYATYMRHKRQKEAEQRAKEAEELRKHLGRVDNSTGPDAAEMLAAS